MDQADGKSVKLSNKIMVSSWMGDPMVCIYSSWIIFFQVEFFEVNFRWNFAVNPFRFLGKISTWIFFPGGKICIFQLILLLYIAFHPYSISCEEKKIHQYFFKDSMCLNSPGFRLDLFVQDVMNYTSMA